MSYYKENCPTSTITRNPIELEDVTGNLYLTVVVAAKRADQIQNEIKEELHQKLENFAAYNDSLDEMGENTEQIEISKYYESLPKPTLLAMNELMSGETYFRVPRKYKKQKRTTPTNK